MYYIYIVQIDKLLSGGMKKWKMFLLKYLTVVPPLSTRSFNPWTKLWSEGVWVSQWSSCSWSLSLLLSEVWWVSSAAGGWRPRQGRSFHTAFESSVSQLVCLFVGLLTCHLLSLRLCHQSSCQTPKAPKGLSGTSSVLAAPTVTNRGCLTCSNIVDLNSMFTYTVPPLIKMLLIMKVKIINSKQWP